MMKKGIFLLMVVFAANFCKAQEPFGKFQLYYSYRPLRADFNLGYINPSTTKATGGISFGFEPQYAVTEHLYLGIRFDMVSIARAFNIKSTTYSKIVKPAAEFNGSYLATADYFLYNKNYRFFIGGGIGFYGAAGFSSNDFTSPTNTITSSPPQSIFGQMLRFGVEYRHLRVSAEYDYIPKTVTSATPISEAFTSINSYAGIKFCYFIGGDRY